MTTRSGWVSAVGLAFLSLPRAPADAHLDRPDETLRRPAPCSARVAAGFSYRSTRSRLPGIGVAAETLQHSYDLRKAGLELGRVRLVLAVVGKLCFSKLAVVVKLCFPQR